MPGSRTQHISKMYIESNEGEKFLYPFKHINGARAMARHVAEGGKPYDDFGKYITGLSEELSKLKKFKSYMGRSSVMAESLSEYMDVVKERVAFVKKTVESLQKQSFYKEAVEGFEAPVLEDVPTDVAENWIDQLTIKQFNEELKDVFPYIYNLVSEATRAKELGPLDLEGYTVYEGEDKKCSCCGDTPCSCDDSCPECGGKGMYETVKSITPEELELESAFDKSMGQFAEGFDPEEFEGEFDYDAVGDDGEEDSATVTYMAKVDDNGKPVVDPKSIKVHASGNNPSSKLGYDVDGDTEMQDMKELLQMAQEDADEMWASRDNKYAHGEGDTIDVKMTPDGGIEKADAKEQKTPLGEFILSYYDRETGEFPKGETAVLTMVEKDYGEKFIEPAKRFIEAINQTFEQFQHEDISPEFERMRELAGLR